MVGLVSRSPANGFEESTESSSERLLLSLCFLGVFELEVTFYRSVTSESHEV